MTGPASSIDPRILGKLLLLQTTMHAIPTPAGIADFVCRGLEEMPGADAVAVTVYHHMRASSPSFANRVESVRRNGSTVPANLFSITIRSLHATYGDIVLETHDPGALEAYRPFLESLANTIALTIENRENEVSLKQLNEGLEAAVQERTSELVAANKALSAEIEERVKAEESLRRSQRFTEILNSISRTFLTSSSDEDMYNDVLRIVLEVMESPFGVFGYIDQKGDLVCPSMTRDIWPQCRMADKTIVFPESSWGNSIWGHGLRTRTPRYANRRFSVPDGHLPVERCLTVPLLHQERSIGVLTVANKTSDYTDADQELLKRIGEYIAPVLNAMLDRQWSEEDRENLRSQLLQAQKLESIGQLAGGIAHDFNNVLAAIVGYGNMLQLKMRVSDPLREFADQILASAERAAGLTRSLLAFSRKQVMDPANIDLSAVVKKVDKFLSRIIGEDVSLAFSLHTEPLTIFADATQIEQVLMNLATNARDAMPKGGTLMIETDRVEFNTAQAVTHSFGKAGPYAALSVSDTGTGMDERTKEKIFDPFFTTKEVGKGTGLGLAIVYGIVKQNNGQINVYSEPGRGTTFKIYFPLIAAGAEDRSGLAAVPTPLPRGTEGILLAEDNEMARTVSRMVLSEHGYTVIEAADGEEALRKFRENGDTIQLIITDVIMPRRSGREVHEEARKIQPDIKVLFMSGYPADLIQKEGVLEKGTHFIPKPSSPQALLQKVREVLDRPSP